MSPHHPRRFPRNQSGRKFFLIAAWALGGACLAVLALAQTTVPTPPLPPLPPPPSPGPPPQAATRLLDANGNTVGIPVSQLRFLRDDLVNICNSPAQLHNYYVTSYLQTSGFLGAPMGAPNFPTLTINPGLQLVLGRQVQLDGKSLVTIEAYRLDKLELIGLAKHEPPVAFVVNRHPVMPERLGYFASRPQAPQVPVVAAGLRPLTDFEQGALGQIKSGTDPVERREDAGSLVVVGSIRAQQSCLQCHTGYKSGDVLGALVYHLSPANLFESKPADQP